MSHLLLATAFENDDAAFQNLILAVRSLYVKNPTLSLGIRIPRKYHALLATTKAELFDAETEKEIYPLAMEKGYENVLLFVNSLKSPSPFPEGFFASPVLRSVQLETDMERKKTFWLGDIDKENKDITTMAKLAASFSRRHNRTFRYFDFGDFPVPEDKNESLKLENIILTSFDGYLFTSGYLANLFLSLSAFFYGLEQEREKLRKKKAGLADYFFNRGAFRKEEKNFADFFRRKGIAFFDGKREVLVVEKQKNLKDYEDYLDFAMTEEMASDVGAEPKSR